MTFSFRNRITLGDKKLQSDEAICTLHESDSGEIVTLFALRRTGDGFSTADWLLVEGGGYESSDQAFKAGKRWRQYLSVAFARVGIAADFDATPLPERRESDRPESPEAPGLIVYPQPSGLSARVESWAEAEVSRPLELFLSEDLPVVREAIPNGLERRLELAYNVFHLALLTNNPDFQYVAFVTAVEALIDDDQKKAPHMVEALGKLREHVESSSDFGPELQESLSKLLQEDEKESINQLGAKLAAQLTKKYDQKRPDTFFKRVYNGRSRILHGALRFTGKSKRPTVREIQRTIPDLHQFVRDLLAVESVSPEAQED